MHWDLFSDRKISAFKKTGLGLAKLIEQLATGQTVRGSNPGGGKIFRTCPDLPWGPPSFLYNGYRFFPGVKSGLGVTLTLFPLLVPLVIKE
jgi:hypothetical protein